MTQLLSSSHVESITPHILFPLFKRISFNFMCASALSTKLCPVPLLLSFETRKLYSSGCPETHYVEEAVTKLRNPPASAS